MQVSFNTRISIELSQWVDEYSKETGISKAQIVAKALEEFKKKVEKKGK